LGEVDFITAWLAGFRLSIDEAIAEVMLPYPNPTKPQRRVSVQYSRDQPDLTPREREVLGLVVCGHSDREIAATLFISRRTASEHVGKVLHKLDAKSRADAAAIAVRSGLV
jgi:DNA-binding NarL/FixJ family response regulator